MKKKILSVFVTMLLIMSACPLGAFALNFNGTASGSGDGSSTTASSGGYAVPNMLTVNSNRAVGYRFTIIDDGGNAQASPVDVFRWSSYTADGIFYAGYYKFDAKYPKTFLKNNYSAMSFSTSGTTASVCHDTDLGMTLPNDTTELPGWCTATNIDTLIYSIWWIHVSALESNAWAVLIEPIFPVKLNGVYHSITVTEIAVYGASRFGAGSNGGSSGNSNSWGFISNYTNWYLPNSLRLTSSYCGMAAAGYLGGRTTFANIIANGYGAAIAYSNCLDYYPNIVRWTYYQNSYDGFYVYVYTQRTASLKIPTWTASNGQDDIIWYDASAQNNTVRGQSYNWILYVPRSNHNYELGYYATHFYAYTAGGKSVASGDGYEPPKVSRFAVRQEDSGGFNVYTQTIAANNLALPVWTEADGQDDLKWHQAYQENNTIDGISYNWRTYIPFSEHNSEIGKYMIHFYVANAWSEGLYATQTTFTPEVQAQLKIGCCEVWQGTVSDRSIRKYGVSSGDTFQNYTYENGYPMLGDSVWFSVNFPPEAINAYVRQTVWIDGGESISRDVFSNDNQWYDVALIPATIDQNRDSYIVKARVDLLKPDGTIDREGEVYTFYIPVRPTLHVDSIRAYSISGDLQASTGQSGDSGAVYYGQRIYSQYKFTSDNAWTSYHNLRNFLYAWNKAGYWEYTYYESETGNADVLRNNVSISKEAAYTATSRIGLYTVPDNSGCGDNKMFYRTATEWTSDTNHTHEETSSFIPILKADVELVYIKLIDENGYIINPQSLEVGQKLTVRYYYFNNTDCTVYVNGFDRNRNQIAGIYAISARQVISVDGGFLTVPNERSITIWGGVYLEGVGIGNTNYEANGSNNERTLECKVNLPLRLTPIAQNADYREKTAVITSYWLTNSSSDDYIPDKNISIKFSVYNQAGKLITTKTVANAVVPAKDKNLYYFKWSVPTGLNALSVRIEASVIKNGNTYNLVSSQYTTKPYVDSVTPDTKFEKSKPDGFRVPPIPANTSDKALWWEYIYENGSFVKKGYGLGISNGGTRTLTPENTATAIKSGSVWTMKSGYGFNLKVDKCGYLISGYTLPPYTAYTPIQYGHATFPEYEYSKENGKSRTLTSSDGMYWKFKQNGSYGEVHFVPLWYPDGDYSVYVYKSDYWTPAGMLSSAVATNTIKIKGSAYDDFYISRKQGG